MNFKALRIKKFSVVYLLIKLIRDKADNLLIKFQLCVYNIHIKVMLATTNFFVKFGSPS